MVKPNLSSCADPAARVHCYRPGREGKEFGVPIEPQAFVSHIKALLDDIQESLYVEAKAFRDSSIKAVTSYDELKAVISEGFWAQGPWAGMTAA